MAVMAFPTRQERVERADETRDLLVATAEHLRELLVELDELANTASAAALRAGRSQVPFDAAKNHIAGAFRSIKWAAQAITE